MARAMSREHATTRKAAVTVICVCFALLSCLYCGAIITHAFAAFPGSLRADVAVERSQTSRILMHARFEEKLARQETHRDG